MTRFFAIFLLWAGIASGQHQHAFCRYDHAALPAVLDDLSGKFDVRYSYADDALTGKLFDLSAGVYALADVHFEIARQTGLKFTKIDDRYYAVSFENAAVPQKLQEVVIENYVSQGMVRSGQKTTLSPARIEELPGVTDADVLFSLQQLPGVSSPYETATGLFVRGGTPDQNLVLWDGIRMTHPGHLFGMISPFNPAMTGAVILEDHATEPRYGQRVSSTISMTMRDSVAQPKVEAGINGLDIDALAEFPLGRKLSIQAAARKSYTEQWDSPAFDAYSRKVFQHTGYNDVDDRQFGFRDATARLNFAPSSKTLISLTGILIDNHLDFTAIDSLSTKDSRAMDIRNAGASLRWMQKIGKKFRVETLLHESVYDFFYQSTQQPQDRDFSALVKKNRATHSGIESTATFGWKPGFTWQFGYQLQGYDLSHAFHDQAPGVEVLLDQRHLQDVVHSGFAQGKWLFGGGQAEIGLRYDRYGRLGNRLEPRLLVEKKIGNLAVQASFEMKSQIESQVREAATNDLSLENYVWVLADGKTYPVEKASQASVGAAWKKNGWLVDASTFYKRISGVTSRSFGFLHLSDTITHKGQGFVHGFDLLVQKSGKDWRAWLTYACQDAQNRYDGLNGDDYFPVSSDIRHSISLSAFKKWRNFYVSAGWFWHSGKPYSTLSDGQIAAFNENRLPVYHRLDISAAYAFKGRTWQGRAGFSALNVYGRSSIISREFERQYQGVGDFASNRYIVRDYRSLGFTPNVFIRITL
jgi:hypothetical protein